MSVTSNARQRIAAILIAVLLIVSLLIVLSAIGRRQDIRRKAAVPQGPATLLLLPGGGDIPAGTKVSISFAVTIENLVVDGFQVVAYVTGTLPADLAFGPAAITSLRLVTSALEQTDGGKKLMLGYITEQPASPYSYSGTFSLGSLVFTAPDSGTLKVDFDTTLSKIIQTQVQKDILSFPSSVQYRFHPLPTPSPTSTPTVAPTPGRRRRPTPTVAPTLTPTPKKRPPGRR